MDSREISQAIRDVEIAIGGQTRSIDVISHNMIDEDQLSCVLEDRFGKIASELESVNTGLDRIASALDGILSVIEK